MTSTGDAIGMMDPAFFVSKTEILSWINTLLQLNVQKVEQCATGAVYCQIIDAIYPGTVQMSKVNWQAKHDYEYSYNYKILQNAFQKNGISRYVDVRILSQILHIQTTKLMKAKYQDNLEFLQWIKRYFDLNSKGNPYDAVGRRKGADLYLICNDGINKVQQAPTNQMKQAPAKKLPLNQNQNPNAQSTMMSSSTGFKEQKHQVGDIKNEVVLQHKIDDLTQKYAQLEEKLMMQEMRSKEIESEKELYFQKLSQLDQFLTDQMAIPEVSENEMLKSILSQIQNILFQEEAKV